MTRPLAARALRRIEVLRSLQHDDHRYDVDHGALEARRQLWLRRSPRLPVVRIRPGLVLRYRRPKSPLQEIASPRGAAVQFLLMLLFEAQCRPPGTEGRPNSLPLARSTDPSAPAWTSLLALPVLDSTSRTPTGQTPAEARLAQVKSSLDRLATYNRVRLTARTGRGRHGNFQLLNEEAANDTSSVTHYSTPALGQPAIEVPVGFFLNGWVHALEDNAIITLLFMLWRAQQEPDLATSDGVKIPREVWHEAFGDGRGYEAYRFLSRCGLVGIDRDERRDDKGHLRDHNRDDPQSTNTESHRFTLYPQTFQTHAIPEMISALENVAGRVSLDAAHWAALARTWTDRRNAQVSTTPRP